MNWHIELNSFAGRLNNPRLEAAYQKYSHRQRQKSVILVNLFDLVVKLIVLVFQLLNDNWQSKDINYNYIIINSIAISLNMILSILPCYSRCYANNYLHWGAAATWILLTFQACYQVTIDMRK